MKMSLADNLTASTTDSLPSMTFEEDFYDGRCETIGENAHAIEIELEPEVYAALSRRGRQRRLRELQSVFPICLRLDRQRKVLHAIGSAEALEAVQTQIESLRGPRKTVSSAVWAELMRTRVLHDDSSVLYRIEQASGCRIHIERKQNEVRLFGPDEASSIADRLLDEFAAQVKELTIDMDVSQLTEDSLHVLAHACGVTLRVAYGQVMIFGLGANVEKAAEELSQHNCSTGNPAPFSDKQVTLHQAPEVPMNTCPPHPLHQVGAMDFGILGPCPHKVESSASPAAQPFHTQQPYMAYAPSQQLQAPKNVCSTCGCGSFCTSCGAPVIGWQHMQGQMLTPNGPMSGYPANTMFVPVMVAQPSAHLWKMGTESSQWTNSNSELQLHGGHYFPSCQILNS